MLYPPRRQHSARDKGRQFFELINGLLGAKMKTFIVWSVVAVVFGGALVLDIQSFRTRHRLAQQAEAIRFGQGCDPVEPAPAASEGSLALSVAAK